VSLCDHLPQPLAPKLFLGNPPSFPDEIPARCDPKDPAELRGRLRSAH